jgi:hypothetical protein
MLFMLKNLQLGSSQMPNNAEHSAMINDAYATFINEDINKGLSVRWCAGCLVVMGLLPSKNWSLSVA